MNLLAQALEVLSDPSNPPGLREVACAALVAGLDGRVAVPVGTQMAIWNWVRETTPRRWVEATFTLSESYDEAVFISALDAAKDPSSGAELRQVALDVITGSAYASLVTGRMIEDLVDRLHVEPDRLTRLIESVHKARGIPVELLRVIRDRWASSTMPIVRDAGVSVGSLISMHEEEFWLTMIADPSEEVRMSAANVVAKNLPTKMASKMLHERLEHEGVTDVRALLHRGMMTVLHRERDGED